MYTGPVITNECEFIVVSGLIMGLVYFFLCYVMLCILIVNVLSLICSPRKTLVIFDSRGRHVLIEDPYIICGVYPGAALLSVGSKIETMISRHAPTSCLVLVGVNDLTTRSAFDGTVQVVANDPFVLANIIIDRILALRMRIMSFWPGVKLVFSGITGIDLNKYNRLPGRSSNQWIIDDCILQVNSYIYGS